MTMAGPVKITVPGGEKSGKTGVAERPDGQ
jgi:hypothetical protein